MSPSGTMVRVYAELRRRIMEGDLRPGDRLDPTRLGKEMLASMTPIRDALHQLKGEGLVESWKHEGFWIAELGETTIRDRYLWCRDLVRLCLLAPRLRSAPVAGSPAGVGYPEAVTDLLLRIAGLSMNQEHMRAMSSLCDRTYLIRLLESRLIDDPAADLRPIEDRIDDGLWDQAMEAFEAFHGRRMEIISHLAGAFRTQTGAI